MKLMSIKTPFMLFYKTDFCVLSTTVDKVRIFKLKKVNKAIGRNLSRDILIGIKLPILSSQAVFE